MQEMSDLHSAIKLVSGSKSLTVKREWVDRWHLLSDLLEVYPGGCPIEWSRDWNELETWMKLNVRMDDCVTTLVTPSSPLFLSEIWSTVDYLSPVDDRWLLHCYIDSDAPVHIRREMYRRLGRQIRSAGVRYPYANVWPDQMPFGIHYNLRIYNDLAYGCRYPCTTDSEVSDHDDSAIDILTGILHTAWIDSLTYQFSDLQTMVEIPWHLIRWKDIVNMADDAHLPSVILVNHVCNSYQILESRQETNDVGMKNLKRMLAGLPLIHNGDAPLEIAASWVPTVLELDGRIRACVPEPALLLDRICTQMDSHPNSLIYSIVLRRQTYSIPTVVQGCALSSLLSRILGKMSLRYNNPYDLCLTIRSSLGSRVLSSVAKSARFQSTGPDRIPFLLIERTAEEVLKEESMDFSDWPIVK